MKKPNRRPNPPPPDIERVKGHCSICPSPEDVDVVKVSHPEASEVAPGVPGWFAFCLRCAKLIGAMGDGK